MKLNNKLKITVKKRTPHANRVHLEVSDGVNRTYISFYEHRLNFLLQALKLHKHRLTTIIDIVNTINNFEQNLLSEKYKFTIYTKTDTIFDFGYSLDIDNAEKVAELEIPEGHYVNITDIVNEHNLYKEPVKKFEVMNCINHFLVRVRTGKEKLVMRFDCVVGIQVPYNNFVMLVSKFKSTNTCNFTFMRG